MKLCDDLTGLLGVTRAMAFVLGVITLMHSSTVGKKPSLAWVCRIVALTPNMLSDILWYQDHQAILQEKGGNMYW